MRIRKIDLIAVVIATLLANFLMINTAQADECWRIQRQLNEAENMLRRGGNSSYMKFWQKARDHNAEELQKCKKRFGNGEPQITVYSGSNNNQQSYRGFISSDINNPQLQSMIKTCNYWIAQANQNASPENISFRDNACRDAETAENKIINPPEMFVMIHKRSAKECIKPNNVIDKEVRECMEGIREPSWISQ